MTTKERLTPEQLAEAIQNRKEAETILATQGLYLTDEEKKLFDEFEAKALTHPERRKLIRQHLEQKLNIKIADHDDG